MSGFRWLVPILLSLFPILGSSAQAAQTQPGTAPIEVVVLGSGGPGATGRASASYLVLIDGVARILVDAGSGAFVRLGEARLSLAKTDVVLLTHLHIDHTGELPGLFKARAVSSSDPIVFDVWGPDGSRGPGPGAYFPATSRFLELLFGPKGAFAYLRDFSAPITLRAHDISVAAHANTPPQVLVKQGALAITAIAGHHGDTPAVVYRIDYAGRSATFSGDIDAQGIPDLTRIAKGSDLLIFNSVVLDPPDSPAVLYTLHSPPQVIGRVAAAAGVRRLVLSHLSPATDQGRDSVLKSIRQNYSGSVSLADDGMRLQP
jgi:ribonuclease BN (tRNA processing enzyme)